MFENDLSRNVRLHLRTVSTMKPHPKAQLPELRLNIRHKPIGNQITAAFLQIASDVLAVFLTLETSTTRLILWNWQDGQLISVRIAFINKPTTILIRAIRIRREVNMRSPVHPGILHSLVPGPL